MSQKFTIKMKTFTFNTIFAVILTLTACSNNKKASPVQSYTNTAAQSSVTFNADSAFAFVKQQTTYGPRVPNTDAHTACAQYFTAKFKAYGAQVEVQQFEAEGYEGTMWQGKNIIASFNPDIKQRIMLSSHWDSRFIAEEDTDESKQHAAIDGANDGASGVGVLIEIARLLSHSTAKVGVDIVLFDVEDQGAPSYAATAETEHSWCLGSQHWSREAFANGYKAEYGILLDMVGASDAVFMKEQISSYYAPQVVDYVWNKAIEMGHGDYFINTKGGTVTDDHLYVNQIAQIPCIDIIDFDIQRGGFSETWHTHDDTIDNIDKNTLNAVGSVLVELIFNN